jgi:2-methylaconitate cis-trans-isomerase PrpF
MKVTQEIVTVWAEPDVETINIVLAGMRITLDSDEAVALASALAKSLERLRAQPARGAGEASVFERAAAKAPEPQTVIVRKDEPASPTAAEVEAMQLRTRALVQASIRDKGLSLREDTRP